jgi:hypothetical protein
MNMHIPRFYKFKSNLQIFVKKSLSCTESFSIQYRSANVIRNISCLFEYLRNLKDKLCLSRCRVCVMRCSSTVDEHKVTNIGNSAFGKRVHAHLSLLACFPLKMKENVMSPVRPSAPVPTNNFLTRWLIFRNLVRC